MLSRVWKVKNNSVGNGVEGVIEKVRFVFERAEEFMKIEGGELFE